jgi:RimJ/RimL family protein N-acetyltransferase
LVWEWIQELRGRLVSDTGPQTLEGFLARQRALFARPTVATFAVYRGNELGGALWYEAADERSGMLHAVWKRSFWGSHTTAPALAAVTSDLFGRRGVDKISAAFFSDNHAVRSMVRQFGFQHEGTLRQQVMRGGRPVDMSLWGLLKGDR